MKSRVGLTLLFGALVLLPILLGTGRSEAAPQGGEPPAAAPAGFTLADWPMSESARRGRFAYEQHCIGCHGVEGRGDGTAAALLSPRPRNLQKNYFKFRTTSSGRLPTPEDLLRTITCGLPGSAMPGFPLLSEPKRRDLVSWVLHLATFGLARNEVSYLVDSEGLSLDEVKRDRLAGIRAGILEGAVAEAAPLPVASEPARTPASIERGRERYLKECAACHGASGRGDGPSSFALRDWEDAEILPRDFTSGLFRAGSTPRDLFVRLKSGLNGTPMPSIGGTDDDLWHLVHYVISLKDATQERRGFAGHCEQGGEGR